MADMKRLETALINAHAAGDTDGARILAQEIKRLRGNEDAAAKMISGAPEIDPTEGMSTTQKVLAGIGMGMTNAARGVGNLVGLVSDADIAEAKRLDAPLANTTAGTVGNFIGSAAAAAPVALLPGANTVVGAGLYGAGTGFALTPGDMPERGTAALMGGAGGMIGQGIPAAYRTLKTAAEPLTKKGQDKILARVLRSAAGDNADVVAQRLRNAAPLVPGSNPTAAEVAESGGIAALQRAMSAADPESYAQRGMEQASARVSALRGIAKDKGALVSAIADRDEAAQSLYGRAFSSDAMRRDVAQQAAKDTAWNTAGGAASVPDLATPGLRSLAQRPGFSQAVESAKRLAADKGIRLDDPLQSLEGLHYVKLALDDMASPSPSNALGRNAQAAVNDMRSRLAKELETVSPLYAQARQVYSDMSAPINQMQVGQELLTKIEPALAQHGGLARETANKYAAALNDVRGTLVENATGGIRRSLEDVMTPEQMQTLHAVAQDLARKSNAQDLGRGVGSNTFQNFAMNNLAQSGGMPSAVSGLFNLVPMASRTAGVVSSAGKALGNVIYSSKDEAMRARMAQALLNPQETAGLMELALTQPGRVAQLLRNPTVQALPGVAGMALPAAQ